MAGMIGVALAVLMLITLVMKWRIINFMWPSPHTANTLSGGAMVAIYVFGTIAGPFGLFSKKRWGFIAAYCAALASTLIGVSVMPGLIWLIPSGFARTYAILGFNATVVAATLFVHVRMHRPERNA